MPKHESEPQELQEKRRQYQRGLADKIDRECDRLGSKVVGRSLSFPNHFERPAMNMSHEDISDHDESGTMYVTKLNDGTYSMAIITADKTIGRPISPGRLFGEVMQVDTEEGEVGPNPYELFQALRVTFDPGNPDVAALAGFDGSEWQTIEGTNQAHKPPYSDAEYFAGTCLAFLADDPDSGHNVTAVQTPSHPALEYLFQ